MDTVIPVRQGCRHPERCAQQVKIVRVGMSGPVPRTRRGGRNAMNAARAAQCGGHVVGDHAPLFAAASERISLTHRSFDRRVHASGAVRAALRAQGLPPGPYGMRGVPGM